MSKHFQRCSAGKVNVRSGKVSIFNEINIENDKAKNFFIPLPYARQVFEFDLKSVNNPAIIMWDGGQLLHGLHATCLLPKNNKSYRRLSLISGRICIREMRISKWYVYL